MAALLLVTAGCSGGEPEAPSSAAPAPSEQGNETSEDGPEPTAAATDAAEVVFTTGDVENMVLAEDDAPGGMKAGSSNLHTAYSSGTLRDNEKAAGHGFLVTQVRSFSTPSALKEDTIPKVGELGIYSLGSYASVYEDAEGAEAHFNDPSPEPDGVRDYVIEPLDEDLGDEARRISWRQKSNFAGMVPYYRVSWRRGNARMAIEGYGLKNSIDEDGMLALARQIDEAATGGAPALELPEFAGGKTAFEDAFDDPKSGWKAEDYSNASAGYQSGKWAMRIDEGGYPAPATGIKRLKDLDDSRVAVETAVKSGKGGTGVQCRIGAKGQYYVATLLTSGTANIGKVTGGANSRYVSLAGVDGAPSDKGPHELQLDCIGDEIVRLQLHVDGEIVAEALDSDDILTSGTPGMYVESQGDPFEATFDNLTIETP